LLQYFGCLFDVKPFLCIWKYCREKSSTIALINDS